MTFFVEIYQNGQRSTLLWRHAVLQNTPLTIIPCCNSRWGDCGHISCGLAGSMVISNNWALLSPQLKRDLVAKLHNPSLVRKERSPRWSLFPGMGSNEFAPGCPHSKEWTWTRIQLFPTGNTTTSRLLLVDFVFIPHLPPCREIGNLSNLGGHTRQLQRV